MNDNLLDDLKQFITATFSQTEARITGRIDNLDKKVDDGFAGIGEAFDDLNKQVDERLTKLEEQAA